MCSLLRTFSQIRGHTHAPATLRLKVRVLQAREHRRVRRRVCCESSQVKSSQVKSDFLFGVRVALIGSRSARYFAPTCSPRARRSAPIDVSPLDGTPPSSPPTPFHHCWPPEARSTFDRLPYGCLLFMYRLDLTAVKVLSVVFRADLFEKAVGESKQLACLAFACPFVDSTDSLCFAWVDMLDSD
jgi:hypothetical protein